MNRRKLKRWYVPNAIYFIVAVTRNRVALFADAGNIESLRATLHEVQKIHPFSMHAYAWMPDHLHLLIFVPETSNISKIMHSLQRNFTFNYKRAHNLTNSVHLWQRSFWDHGIRDEADYFHHIDYIHYNPVKHGLVLKCADYPYTSFAEYVRRGWYPPDWGQGDPAPIDAKDRQLE